MATIQGKPDESAKGWQDDGVDVEIERVHTRRGRRYRWVLYDRARRVRSGTRRSHRGAQIAGTVAALLYRAIR